VSPIPEDGLAVASWVVSFAAIAGRGRPPDARKGRIRVGSIPNAFGETGVVRRTTVSLSMF
jgi:hypothetical protein